MLARAVPYGAVSAQPDPHTQLAQKTSCAKKEIKHSKGWCVHSAPLTAATFLIVPSQSGCGQSIPDAVKPFGKLTPPSPDLAIPSEREPIFPRQRLCAKPESTSIALTGLERAPALVPHASVHEHAFAARGEVALGRARRPDILAHLPSRTGVIALK